MSLLSDFPSVKTLGYFQRTQRRQIRPYISKSFQTEPLPKVRLGETPRPTRETRALPGLRCCASSVACAELDALGERKFPRKIDRVGLAAHVIFPGVAPAFPAAAGVFFPAKCAPDLRAARAGI